MVALSAFPFAARPLPGWNLFYARESDPDLDFEEDLDDLDETPQRSYTPRNPRKKSGGRLLLWLVLLIIVGGGGYLAMEPEVAMEFVASFTGETPAPPLAVRPPPKVQARIPLDLNGQGLSAPSTPTTAAPTSVEAAIPSPQFMEGQLVSVILDPTVPGGSLSLSADPTETRAGPKVRPGAMLTILDGSLQENTWVYAVQTQDGATGWIAEKRLVAKP